MLWIGMALLLVWGLNLFHFHVVVPGHRTSNPYMAQVDRICERRVNNEASLGDAATSADVGALWAIQMGAIDSMPPPPPSAKHDMSIVKGSVRDILHYIGRYRSRIIDTSDPAVRRRLTLDFIKRYDAQLHEFKKLGLPYCAHAPHLV
jgi:hypothetical protein